MSSLINRSISRRAFIEHSAKGVTLGALVSALGYTATEDMQKGGITGSACLTLLYQNAEGVTFDYDYYRDHHLKTLMEKYGTDAISRFEFRKVFVAEHEPAPAYVACASIWIKDAEKFAAAGVKYGQELGKDVANFTNAKLLAQNEIVWAEAGANLHKPVLGQRCTMLLYPFKEGAHWDGDYYRDHHMPMIMGFAATGITRFEVRKARAAANGANPLFFGTVGIYIADQALYSAGTAPHREEMSADVARFSSEPPLRLYTDIYGLHV